MRIDFFVSGTPVPKGSMKAFPFYRKNGKLGVSMTHANSNLAPWVHAVAFMANEKMNETGMEIVQAIPLVLEVKFFLPRPKSHLGTRGILSRAPRVPHSRPDLDKLVRAVCDALQGVLYDDDSRIVSVVAVKEYARTNDACGALITVREHEWAEHM